MEKKTMGSFLAALRKANGLTQKDVADRLAVSDKAVSRWERDETLPDITLIPALAEMFGVTCDELLKGEKATENATNQFPTSGKIDKQRKTMLNNSLIEFKNKIVLSVVIGHIGGALMLLVGFPFNSVAGAMFCLCGLLVALYFGITALIKLNNLVANEEELELEDRTILLPFKRAKNRAIRILIIMTIFLSTSLVCCISDVEVGIAVFVFGLGVELIAFAISEFVYQMKEKRITYIANSMIWQDAIQWLIIIFICLYPVLDMCFDNHYIFPDEGIKVIFIIMGISLVVSTIIGILFAKFSKTYKKKVKFITIRNLVLTLVGIGWTFTIDLNWQYSGMHGWYCDPSMSVLSWILIPVIIAGTVIVTIMWNKKHSWEM